MVKSLKKISNLIFLKINIKVITSPSPPKVGKYWDRKMQKIEREKKGK